jgi:exodeoxyribonuclease VII large subunit
VVTGVGHEIDTSLADLAADLRAPTPSAAAELVVRERDQLLARVASLRAAIAGALRRGLDQVRTRVLTARAARGFREPARRLGRARLQLADGQRRLESALVGRLRALSERLRQLQRRLAPENQRGAVIEFRGRRDVLAGRAAAAVQAIVVQVRARLAENARRLDALSPLAVLSRGYALVTREGPAGVLVRSADELRAGDDLFIRLGSGAAEARVTRARPGPTPGVNPDYS